MRFTTLQRSKIVIWYTETKSPLQVQRKFCATFDTRMKDAPSKKTILQLVKKFETHGTILNRHIGNSGRKKTARSEENIATVRESVLRSPKKSLRRRSQELNLSVTAVYRILRSDLKCYPYCIQIKQTLTESDKLLRVQMCEWLIGKMEDDNEWIDNVWFSDEAHFQLNGVVNSHNARYWGTENPHEVTQKPLHSKRCTAWCALSSKGIVGPYWFEDEEGKAETINQANYRDVVKRFCASLRRRRGIVFNTQWFQQDGATPHTAYETRAFLTQKFGNRVISLKTEHVWAPHSPDLNPLDFFLWGYCKDNVYRNNPSEIGPLKREIETFIKKITVDTCKAVIHNFAVRVRECMLRSGAHMEHMIHDAKHP